MSELGAQNGVGGRSDPDAAARCRKMTLQLRRAREALTGPDAIPSHSTAMVRLFAEINRSAAPALGLSALGLCAIALAWVGAGALVIWSALIVCAIALTYALPIAFLELGRRREERGRMAARVCARNRLLRLGLGAVALGRACLFPPLSPARSHRSGNDDRLGRV